MRFEESRRTRRNQLVVTTAFYCTIAGDAQPAPPAGRL